MPVGIVVLRDDLVFGAVVVERLICNGRPQVRDQRDHSARLFDDFCHRRRSRRRMTVWALESVDMTLEMNTTAAA